MRRELLACRMLAGAMQIKRGVGGEEGQEAQAAPVARVAATSHCASAWRREACSPSVEPLTPSNRQAIRGKQLATLEEGQLEG